jgi:hypothetical protein
MTGFSAPTGAARAGRHGWIRPRIGGDRDPCIIPAAGRGMLTPTRPTARWLPGRGARRYPSRLVRRLRSGASTSRPTVGPLQRVMLDGRSGPSGSHYRCAMGRCLDRSSPQPIPSALESLRASRRRPGEARRSTHPPPRAGRAQPCDACDRLAVECPPSGRRTAQTRSGGAYDYRVGAGLARLDDKE